MHVLGETEEQPDCFHHVMRGCRRALELHDGGRWIHDLLGDAHQAMFDLAFDREQRREQRGYVTRAQARAFLQM
jgi:hypothetical protein